MSANASHELAANRLMARLSGFIQGIGMSGPDARRIVDRVSEEMPHAGDGDREATARAWMLIALA
ncbi:MAG: hypothetical protein INR70_21155 [Parafilimonas terrae]|nr:hypothetical protein [Parafilimonas terrae]